MRKLAIVILFLVILLDVKASDFYVSPTGNDDIGTGSKEEPWKSIGVALAKIPRGGIHTLKLTSGTFIVSHALHIPATINVEGAGPSLTILKAGKSFFYNPETPGTSPEKFLMFLNDNGLPTGKQFLRNFAIDGSGKQLHGGIYINHRDNIVVENLKIQNVNFCGLWILNSKGSILKNISFTNSAWASTSWCSGALQIANLQDTEIFNITIDEDRGYGIKALSPSGNSLTNVKIHDSRISVNPIGIWNEGKAPNISIELWSANLLNCEIFNCYVDNHISLVKTDYFPPVGAKTIRVHHNTIDLKSRAKGQGYGIELSVNKVEIDHNVLLGGQYGIVNWAELVKDWSIHHNIFVGLENEYPSEVLRSQQSGFENVKFYNNTIEFQGTRTVNVIGLYGGKSNSVDVKNNLVINSNSAYSHYPNKLVRLENASIDGLTVHHNLFFNLDVADTPGQLLNNKMDEPRIKKLGTRHIQYYQPIKGSPLIDAGIDVGLPFKGAAPDIGAHEY